MFDAITALLGDVDALCVFQNNVKSALVRLIENYVL